MERALPGLGAAGGRRVAPFPPLPLRHPLAARRRRRGCAACGGARTGRLPRPHPVCGRAGRGQRRGARRRGAAATLGRRGGWRWRGGAGAQQEAVHGRALCAAQCSFVPALSCLRRSCAAAERRQPADAHRPPPAPCRSLSSCTCCPWPARASVSPPQLTTHLGIAWIRCRLRGRPEWSMGWAGCGGCTALSIADQGAAGCRVCAVLPKEEMCM